MLSPAMQNHMEKQMEYEERGTMYGTLLRVQCSGDGMRQDLYLESLPKP